MYLPVFAVTVPSVLLNVLSAEWIMHWNVVESIKGNTVNAKLLGVVGFFGRYGLFTSFISSSLNDTPLIIHVTGSGIALWYPQLMITVLPLHTVVFSGGVVIVTIGKHIQ